MSTPDLSLYGEDVLRTSPDYVAYVPKGGTANDWTNQHFLVVPSWSGAFLAVWTMATFEGKPDQRVVFARSDDAGVTWSAPRVVDGPSGDDGRIASWGFPVLAPELRRVYVFYTKNIGVVDVREDTTGLLAYKYSDDEGESWSEQLSLPIERSAISPTDPGTPENWICYQMPILNPRGEVVCGFTRWACTAYHVEPHLFQRHSECWFLRFENILTEPDPKRLRVSTWPKAPHGIRVPKPGDPEHSIAQEPSIQNLPDGRMLCLLRTLTGYAWWSVSEDAGESWSEAEVLRFASDGRPVPHPISPCPLYRLSDGRYLLIFHNNVGTAHGGEGPHDSKRNRRPAWFSIGTVRDSAEGQPLAFGEPQVLTDNDGVELPPEGHTQVATYGSLFEHEGRTIWWYPDRKHYLVGKILNDLLAERA